MMKKRLETLRLFINFSFLRPHRAILSGYDAGEMKIFKLCKATSNRILCPYSYLFQPSAIILDGICYMIRVIGGI